MKKFTLLMLLMIVGMIPVYATHLMGGDITLQDLGNQEYRQQYTPQIVEYNFSLLLVKV